MSSAAPHIGADLRAERERLGLALDAVAEELHVRESYLDAIERGERANTPGVLPGVGYVLGYIRAYAHEIGLDGDNAVDRYKAEMAIPENLRLRDAPHIVTRRRRRLPRGIIGATVVAVAAVAFALYYGTRGGGNALDSAPSAMVAGGASEIGPDTWILRATTASYVRVVSGDGDVLFNAIMVPGQVVTLPRGTAPVVEVRDAGAVTLALGAREFGAMGPRGQSLRDYALANRLTDPGEG